jgi:hypothetical protein
MANYAFRDLPAAAFPFTVELLDAENRDVRWQARCDEPGALHIPSRDEINDGRRLTCRITFGDGTVRESAQDA